MPPVQTSIATSSLRHDHVFHTLGTEICGNRIPTDTVFTADSIESRFQVSRSVVREALRGLEALGLVASKRRVGVTVQPLSSWNVFDIQVIRWRLAGEQRSAQLRSLTELRATIEPAAVRLAALHAPRAQVVELVGLSSRLWEAGRAGDEDEFLALDIEYHGLVLQMSGNEMFAKLHHLVDAVLTGRTEYGLMPRFPAQIALQHHVDVATAIQAGQPDAASEAMLAIMKRTVDEMTSIWGPDDLPKLTGPIPVQRFS